MSKLIKLFLLILITFISFFTISTSALTKNDNQITIYFFHGDGCPHCEDEKSYLNELTKEYNNIKVVDYEVWYNEENESFLKEVKEKLNIKESGVPITIVGNTKILGYKDDYSTGSKIKRAVKYYQNNTYIDVISKIKDNTYNEEEVVKENIDFLKQENKSDKESTIKLPIIGKVNLKSLPLSSSTSIIGLLNGVSFNSLWIILQISAIILIISTRRKQWLYGFIFFTIFFLANIIVLTTGISIPKDLNNLLNIINIFLILLIIIINIRNYLISKKTTEEEFSKRSILNKIIIPIITILTISIIVFSSDITVLNKILSINNIFGFESILYVVNYTVFYLLLNIIIFSIIMLLLRNRHINKLKKYFYLISVILFMIVEILLIAGTI